MGSKSVVMNASTDLLAGTELDAQLQVTTTPTGDVYVNVCLPGNGCAAHLRISAQEWARLAAPAAHASVPFAPTVHGTPPR